MLKKSESPWNSLETVKLIVSGTVPLLLVVIGFLIWGLKNDIAQIQAEQNRIREMRIDLYSKAGPNLNDVFAYHFYVGKWKEFTPRDIVAKKRELDSMMYTNEPLFTDQFFNRYRRFMNETFATGRGWYFDAALRTSSQCRKRPQSISKEDWTASFTDEDNRKEVCIAYTRLLANLSQELLFVTLKNNELSDSEIVSKKSVCPPFYSLKNCDPQ